jgi:hypothetical protein
MPKSHLRARAKAEIFQCVIYDSKSRKRGIVVYACGDDVKWSTDLFGLFDRDRVNDAPTWLKDQIRALPADAVELDFRGVVLSGTAPAVRDDAPVLRVPDGESLGDEDSIRQGV